MCTSPRVHNVVKQSTLPKLQQHSMQRKTNSPSKTMANHTVLMVRVGTVSDFYHLEMKDDSWKSFCSLKRKKQYKTKHHPKPITVHLAAHCSSSSSQNVVSYDLGQLLQSLQLRMEHIIALIALKSVWWGPIAARQVCLEVEHFSTHYQVAEFLMENTP